MVQVTTSLTVTQAPFPFSGLEDILRPQSYVPLQEYRAYTVGESIPATGAGDNQRFLFQVTLPRNFAYAIVDLGVRITGANGATNNWDNQLNCIFENASSPTLLAPIALNSAGSATSSGAAERKIYSPARLPNTVVIPNLSTDSCLLVMDGYNATANDGAYSIDVLARFLQYTIAQANNWQVNTPMPVR